MNWRRSGGSRDCDASSGGLAFRDPGSQQLDQVVASLLYSSVSPAIVFDLGRVLLDFDPNRPATVLASILGIDLPAAAKRLKAIEHPFETGQIDTERVFTILLEGLDPAGDKVLPGALERARRLIAAAMGTRFSPLPETIELAHELSRAGHTLALGSNTNPLDMEAVRDAYPDALEPFGDRLFLSYRIGVMKPNPRYYQAVADGLGLPIGDCIFIDDRPENVAGARRTGMRGILFRGAAALRSELAGLLAA